MIVTADHGEELGEHGLFEHGESLYRPEIRVPLVFAPPSHGPSPEAVSDVVGLATCRRRSLTSSASRRVRHSRAGRWRGCVATGRRAAADRGALASDGAVSELPEPNPARPSLGLSPAARGPLSSLAEGDYLYIRNERHDGREQLFDRRRDPAESCTTAPSMSPCVGIVLRIEATYRSISDKFTE